jgi:DNA-nicking Smr family endonuclease
MTYYSNQKPNKYPQIPDIVLDFHGLTTVECKAELDEIIDSKEYTHIRIIVGKGTRSPNGPILPDFVRNFFTTNNIRFSPSKPQDGGDGALEVFL